MTIHHITFFWNAQTHFPVQNLLFGLNVHAIQDPFTMLNVHVVLRSLRECHFYNKIWKKNSCICYTQLLSNMIFIYHYIRRMGCCMVPRVKDNSPLARKRPLPWVGYRGPPGKLSKLITFHFIIVAAVMWHYVINEFKDALIFPIVLIALPDNK